MHNPGAPGLDAPLVVVNGAFLDSFQGGLYRSYCILTIVDWRSQVAMAKHAPPDKGEGDIFGKEDSPNFGGNIGKGVSHAAYNKIFKQGGILCEWELAAWVSKVALMDKFKR